MVERCYARSGHTEFADLRAAYDALPDEWNDRCTMHRGTDFDDLRWRRDMHRATVSDIANTCEQAGISFPTA